MPDDILNGVKLEGNSNNKQKPPEASKVVTQKVVIKKKSFGQKLVDIFIADDMEHVKGFIFEDVIIPSIKRAISQGVTGAINMILFGSNVATTGGDEFGGKYNQRTPYWKYSTNSTPAPAVRPLVSRFDTNDIILQSREDAEIVVTELTRYIEEFGFVSVAYLYGLVGITAPPTAYNYGWRDLNTYRIRPTLNGTWALDLPRPVLDRY